MASSSWSISSARLSASETKLAGPFSDTCRCSISPRSRLRLRPARRAALTMTLMRAECSMDGYDLRFHTKGVLPLSTRKGWGEGVPCHGQSVKRLICRQIIRRSFGCAEPAARGLFAFGTFLGAEIGECLVELRIAFAGGLGDQVPFQGFHLVRRRA